MREEKRWLHFQVMNQYGSETRRRLVYKEAPITRVTGVYHCQEQTNHIMTEVTPILTGKKACKLLITPF